jgi:hypothetical protein
MRKRNIKCINSQCHKGTKCHLGTKCFNFLGKTGHETHQDKFEPRDKMSHKRFALLKRDEMSHHDILPQFLGLNVRFGEDTQSVHFSSIVTSTKCYNGLNIQCTFCLGLNVQWTFAWVDIPSRHSIVLHMAL